MADDLSDQIPEFDTQLSNRKWLAEESKHRGLIDEICKEYAQYQKWPIGMTMSHMILIYFRLVEGANHAERLSRGHAVHNQTPEELDSEREAALNLLLVDYWHSAGRARWLTS